jgi:formylglycine-generating enzyme
LRLGVFRERDKLGKAAADLAIRSSVATIREVRAILTTLLLVACEPAGASLGAPPQPSAAQPSVAAPVARAPETPVSPAPAVPTPPPLSDACPPEMARVGKSCIDRWEAQLVNVESGAVHPHSERPEPGARYAARSASGVAPQAYVNRLEAKAACAAASKRLCSVSEWYAACLGPKKQTYGYGARYEKGRCNAGKPHLLGKLFGNDPRRWSFADFNSPKLNLEPGFLAKTGEHAGCTNDYGVYDMIGNLHEWVSDHVDDSLAFKLPLRDDIRDKLGVNRGHGIFMGGFYSTVSEHGRGCGFVTPGHGPKYHDYSTGFRCCRDAAAGAR